MDIKNILSKCDHTLLGVDATWNDIKGIVDDGMKYETASVCIPASFVKQAAEYVKAQGGHLPICTVIGFPNGYATTASKCFMASDAVDNGASEVDICRIPLTVSSLFTPKCPAITAFTLLCLASIFKYSSGLNV